MPRQKLQVPLPCWVARWFCRPRHMPEAVAAMLAAVAFTAAVASMAAVNERERVERGETGRH